MMIAKEMVERDVSIRTVAGQLGVDESTLRYRLGRAPDAPDGRRDRGSALDGWTDRVTMILERCGDARVVPGAATRCQAQVVHAVLVREFGFRGSYQAVRRYLKRTYVSPVQAVRRVETPPGVQAQHDWFESPVVIGGARIALYGLIGTLSHSRATFVWASPTMTQLAWQTGHLALFQRYGGVPLWVRMDNLKTGVASGAGPTAVFNPAFVTFARACGFGLDACRAATGSDKGKTERQVRTRRGAFTDLLLRPWGAVPLVHEPFDVVVARRVSRDCLVSFEGRRYSVPFCWVGRVLEIRGTARDVVCFAEGPEVARHARGTAATLVLEPTHYEGPSTSVVRAPTPLGRRARQQLDGLPGWPAPSAVARPMSAYVALVEEACR
jgi:transposase